MERVCMYLRKSRADLEAEARGEGETLAKHKKALLKLAKSQGLNIVKIREEIVSGESLLHRPEMQELLKEVDSSMYDAVLVMDVDRLGRGNMQEQGLILETFRQSKTKIITPRKIYDLQDEWDEEYSEFEAFMARKELKLINRRLQGGRVRSVEEGNYIGARPPYGYQVHNTEHGRTLIPHPDQASIVKMIFDRYTQDDPHFRMGSNKIAQELNRMGCLSYSGKAWSSASVLNTIKNAVYIGRVQWKKKEQKKSTDPNKRRDTRTRPKSEWIDVEGKHEPLISAETFQKAQDILRGKYHIPYQLENGITNPLAGLIKCDVCGASMVYRPYTRQQAHLICYNNSCQNKSTRFSYVEERLIMGLEHWLSNYKAQFGKRKRPENNTESMLDLRETAIRAMERELKELDGQKGRLHDFLERGIYDEETYLDRSKNVAERMETIRASIEKAEKEIQNELKREKAQRNVIPMVQQVLELYHQSDDPAKKNTMLKSILEKAVYRKEKNQKGDNFSLTLFPKLPQ